MAAEAHRSGAWHTSLFALALALTGVCAFLHPPMPARYIGPSGPALAPTPLGPAWVRVSIGLGACAAAVAASVLYVPLVSASAG
jgi:hypothetical protein